MLSPAPPDRPNVMPGTRLAVFGALIALCLTGWLYLMVAGGGLAGISGLALFGSGFGMPGANHWGAGDVLLVGVMWLAMAVAMMLPTAAPMLVAYVRLARAEQKGPSLLYLAGGYLTIWFSHAALATGAQAVMTGLGSLSAHMAPAGPALGASILIAAGLYQFTPAKWLCLARCRTPLAPLLGEVPETGLRLYRLGLEEGIACLGSCWALMAVMFAVGLMNLIWMAGLGVVMGLEKIASGRALTILIGIGLLVAGGLMAAPLVLRS